MRNEVFIWQWVGIDNKQLQSRKLFLEADVKPVIKPDNLGTLGLIENGAASFDLSFWDEDREHVKLISWIIAVKGPFSGTALAGTSSPILEGSNQEVCFIFLKNNVTTHLKINVYEQYLDCFGSERLTDIVYANPNLYFYSRRDRHKMSLTVDNIMLYYK